MKHSHYKKSVAGLEFIDVYRVLSLYGVTDPCIQHAIKKLLVAGDRGHKDIEHDVQDAIDTLNRWQEMRSEDTGIPKSHKMPETEVSIIVTGPDSSRIETRQILPDLLKPLPMSSVKPPKSEPASEIDDESERMNIIARNGNNGEHYGDPLDLAIRLADQIAGGKKGGV